MNVHRRLRTALAATLAVALPGSALAQSEVPDTPEGPEWVLTSYYLEEAAELAPVPFPVEPTLLLQEGVASGLAGCNQFSGSYEIDGGALRFSEEMSVTLALCDDPAQSIEDAYLALLSEVDGWIIDTSTLELTNQFGEVILAFETPSIMWTSSQMAALMATLAELRTGLDLLQGLLHRGAGVLDRYGSNYLVRCGDRPGEHHRRRNPNSGEHGSRAFLPHGRRSRATTPHA